MQMPDFLRTVLVTACMERNVRVDDIEPKGPPKKHKTSEVKHMHEPKKQKHQAHANGKPRKHR